MSATADKARFFLEQSVPELKELERKKIFDAEEIAAIAKKRSDFEHKINARGSTPSDYAHYAEFEMNVDALRKKRIKRLGVKATTHTGQRRIFFVFDRGTRKFPGDIGIWMQSIEYARKQKAFKKMTQLLTTALRLHPAKADLWIYAAQTAIEDQADMTEARGYMQRGLRFCKNSRNMWKEYLRLEMSYIAKIHTRRQVLGIADDATRENGFLDTEDYLQLPAISAEDIAPTTTDVEINASTLRKLDSTPIMSGAIPIAIFDAAMEHFSDDLDLAHDMVQIVLEYDDMPTTPQILQHMNLKLTTISEIDWRSEACAIAVAVSGVDRSTVEFPGALRIMLQRLSTAISRHIDDKDFLAWSRRFLDTILQDQMDPALRTVLESRRRTLEE